MNSEKCIRSGFLNAMANVDVVVARRENVLAFGSDLYHYTSLVGLQGIIETNGFFASDNRFMNDTEETRHGLHLAAKVLEHKIKHAPSDFAQVLAAVRDQLIQPAKNGNLVACFSTARDSLEQWRGYGSNGGVCLRLGTPAENERPVFFANKQIAFRVIYKTRRKFIALLSIIRRYALEYARDRAAMPGGDWPFFQDNEYIKDMVTMLSMRIKVFKDPSFEQEKEVRIVLSYNESTDYSSGIKFRASPFGLIPYVNTGDRLGSKGLLPLREVLVGPASRQNLIAESIMTFLERNGYAKTKVSCSTVPFRSAY